MFGVGLVVRHSRRSVLFDHWFDMKVASPSGMRHWWAFHVAQAGDPKYFVLLMAVVVLLLLVGGELGGAISAVVSVVVAVTLVELILKPFFDRRLPGLETQSFPSGHGITAFALAGSVALAVGSGRPLARRIGRFGRGLIAVVALAVAAAVGLAMVALQAHFATDVVTGAALGLVIAGGVGGAVDMIGGRLCPLATTTPEPVRTE